MTPKEKAEELIEKYKSIYVTVEGCKDGGNPCIVTNNMFTNAAARCAKIAVEEVLYALQVPSIENKGSKLYDSQIQYWNEVLILTHKL
jgi:hypothetical protein